MTLSKWTEYTSSKVLKTPGCGRFIYKSLSGWCRRAEKDESTLVKTLGSVKLKSLGGGVGGGKYVCCSITDRVRKSIAIGGLDFASKSSQCPHKM
jgi:hypothetical protein